MKTDSRFIKNDNYVSTEGLNETLRKCGELILDITVYFATVIVSVLNPIGINTLTSHKMDKAEGMLWRFPKETNLY